MRTLSKQHTHLAQSPKSSQPAPFHIMSSTTLQIGERETPARLLAEIQLLILKDLMQDGSCSLGPLATVSKEWQIEIEKRNFAQIKVTTSHLREFESMAHRNRTLVRYIWFCVELEEYDCIDCGRSFALASELGWQQHRCPIMSDPDNWPITRAFHDLFSILSTWESNGDLILDISIYSPSDSKHFFKYLDFAPDALPGTLGRRRAEQTMPGQVFDDIQHGWLDGIPDPPPSSSFRTIFPPFMERSPFLRETEERQWWDQLPLVPAVTSLFLRQQNRRQWKRYALAHMLSRFSRLQEIHYEPWRRWSNPMQNRADGSEFCHEPFQIM